MAKCIYCGEAKKLGPYGYCEDCYNDLSSDIRNQLATLERLETRSKSADLTMEEKQEIANQAVACGHALKEHKRKGVLFFKSDFRPQIAAIHANLGIPLLTEFTWDEKAGAKAIAKNKKSTLLLISAIIGTLYIIYLLYYCSSTLAAQTDSAAALGTTIGIALIFPHAFMTFLSVIFNWVGWAANVRWGALTAGILYSVATFLMPLYFMYTIIEVVLCFVGFARMKRPQPQTVG